MGPGGGAPLGDLERLDPGQHGQVEQLGQLSPDLAGVGVDRVSPGQDEVERAAPPKGGGEGVGRGERVRTGEGGIGDEHAVIGTPRYGFTEHVLGGGRAHGEHGAGAAGLLGELDALAHRTAAVGVHLQLGAVAPESAVGSERHVLEPGHLLDEDGDTKRHLQSNRCGRPGHGAHRPEPLCLASDAR